MGRLASATAALSTLAETHGDCLRCHCYREVAEEALALAEAVETGALGLAEDERTILLTAAFALRARLAGQPGTHG